MYAKYIKRLLDAVLSLMALVVLSPVLLILALVGAAVMKGNPFFFQLRPGKIDKKTGEEKIFKLVKFKSMNNAKDAQGNLLPDGERLTPYGKFIRKTSLDELPELLNILKGDMSIVGPRPLLVQYIPLYNTTQRERHLVRPGLTGYAQVNGRNAISWEERFALDVEYVKHITFLGDVKIILRTVAAVLKREGISSETAATMEAFTGTPQEVS